MIEDVHDDGSVVHQHPREGVEAFDPEGAKVMVDEQPFLDVVDDGLHLAAVGSRGDDEPVGNAEDVADVEPDAVLSKFVFRGIDCGAYDLAQELVEGLLVCCPLGLWCFGGTQ